MVEVVLHIFEKILAVLPAERLLQLAALILSIVNGLILIRVHIRDRAKLDVSPVHPDVYQWWFRLPESTFHGSPTRVFGFLAYVSIVNRGYRPVALERWRLHVRARNGRRVELRAVSIPEPMLKMGSHGKVYAVLGQAGLMHQGSTQVEAGSGIGGMVFYVYECYGDDSWNPRVRNAKIGAHFTIRDVFRGKASCNINFREQTLQEIKRLIPDIENIPYSGEKDESTPAR